MEGVVYLNGEYLPAKDAMISVYDHGFLYGDGIFESMVAAGESVFRLEQHIDRFYRSAAALRLHVPVTKTELANAVRETVRRNNLPLSYIRVVLSRGPGYPSLDPRVSQQPTLVILVHPRTIPERDEGDGTEQTEVRAITVILASVRRIPSEAIDARIKACNYINHILARFEAIDAGADDAILLDTHGYVAEATAANVFAVYSENILTPPLGNILEGITRATVMDIARELKYTVLERHLTPYDLFVADEVFLTSTFGGVIPVGKVAGRTIGNGNPGPITLRLRTIIHAMRDGKPVS